MKKWIRDQLALIHKPVSFWSHAAIPGIPLVFAMWACLPIALPAYHLFVRYQLNEGRYLPKDRMYQDVQGVVFILVLAGTIIGALILAGILPPCPWLGIWR